MRWSWMLVLSLAATSARAEAPVDDLPRPAGEREFWPHVIDPHAGEVAALIAKARLGMQRADEALQNDAEWAVAPRMRYFEDAYGMMRYARRLSPEQPDVLVLLGQAADEVGKTRTAIDAYEAYVHLVGPDKASREALGRLGAIYLRLGNHDAALRWLRLAQGPLRPDTVHGMVHLANALATQGEVTTATDLLAHAIPASSGYQTNEHSLAMFALAVIYDRDEQRSAAFEVLDRLQTTLQTAFQTQLQNALATMRFAPAADRHYYQGLLYEALGQYPEARAAFALYAASGPSPWRARSLDHVRAIDERQRTPPTAAAATTPPPPPRIQHRSHP